MPRRKNALLVYSQFEMKILWSFRDTAVAMPKRVRLTARRKPLEKRANLTFARHRPVLN
jgi:hypothetical protein